MAIDEGNNNIWPTNWQPVSAQHVEQHIEQMHFNKPTSAEATTITTRATTATRDVAVIGKNRQPQTTTAAIATAQHQNLGGAGTYTEKNQFLKAVIS